MLRGLVYLILTIFAITFIRSVIGLIGKAVAQLFEPVGQPIGKRSGTTPSGGRLVQCPGCGIYVSTETKLRKTSGGKTHYFCSEKCMKEFRG